MPRASRPDESRSFVAAAFYDYLTTNPQLPTIHSFVEWAAKAHPDRNIAKMAAQRVSTNWRAPDGFLEPYATTRIHNHGGRDVRVWRIADASKVYVGRGGTLATPANYLSPSRRPSPDGVKNDSATPHPVKVKSYAYAVCEVVSAIGGDVKYADIRRFLPAALDKGMKMPNHQKLHRVLYDCTRRGFLERASDDTWRVPSSKHAAPKVQRTKLVPMEEQTFTAEDVLAADSTARAKVVRIALLSFVLLVGGVVGYALSSAL